MAGLARTRRVAPADPLVLAALDSFTLALEAAERTPAYIEICRAAVTQFVGTAGNLHLSEVEPDHLRRHLVALKARSKPSTLHTRWQQLRRFFAWCEHEDLVERSPMARVEAPKLPELVRPGFTEEEVLRLLAATGARTPVGARDRAFMLCLYDTGLRVSELLSLRRADVVSHGATQRYLRVLGKGRRERLIAIAPAVKQAIADYLMRRGDDDDPCLWLGTRGPLTRSGARQLCYEAGKRAGMEHVHPHRFRNAALSAMLHAGMSLEEVQAISGHRRVDMLAHYVRFSREQRANDKKLDVDVVGKMLQSAKPPRKRR